MPRPFPCRSLLAASAGTLIGLAGCDAGPPVLTLPVKAPSGQSATPPPPTPEAEAKDPAVKAIVRQGEAVTNALLAGWKTFAPLLVALKAKRKEHPPAGYRLAAVPDWRFFAGGWSSGEDPARKLRVVLDDGKDAPATWDVADEASYGTDGKSAFPATLNRLRLTIDEALPDGGRLNVTYVFALGEPHQAFQAGGLGSVAQAGVLGPLVVDGLQANVWANGVVKEGEVVLRGTEEGTTLQASCLHDGVAMTSVRLQRAGKVLGEALPAGGGNWVLRKGESVYAL